MTVYLKVSFGGQRCYSEFGGCPIFGSRKCTASTGIAVGTSTVVRYSEEVRYWEGPLSEVPCNLKRVLLRVFVGRRIFSRYRLRATTRFTKLQCYKRSKIKMAIPETAEFDVEKLAVTLNEIPGPTYQLVLRMRILTMDTADYYSICPFGASWRLRVRIGRSPTLAQKRREGWATYTGLFCLA